MYSGAVIKDKHGRSIIDIGFFSKELPSDAPSGVSKQVHWLANSLCETGHTVTCYSFSPLPADARYTHIHLGTRALSRPARLFAPALCFRALQHGKHDVFHYHGDDYLCFRALPRVRTFYGSALSEARFAATWPRRCRQMLFYLFELISCTHTGRKIGISTATCRVLPGVDEVIPCGVPSGSFTRGTDVEKSEQPTLLFIGDFKSRKRGDLLLDLFETSVRSVYAHARLLIVGPERITAPGVEWLGRISEADLARAYRRAWVYCMVSSYEGFGVPVLEAMACGTPVVAVSNPGTRDIITDGRDGILCERERFSERLLTLLGDRALRESLAQAGAETVKRYDMNRIASRYESVYAAVCGKTE